MTAAIAIRTPVTVRAGTWQGNAIRRARKEGQCEYWRGRDGRCPTIIRPGDLYMEGSQSRFSGSPFAVERYCMECAGPEARAAVTP